MKEIHADVCFNRPLAYAQRREFPLKDGFESGDIFSLCENCFDFDEVKKKKE